MTQINTTSIPLFMSAIIDSYNSEILDYRITTNRYDFSFIYQNIENAVKKCKGSKPILHSDNAIEYQSKEYYDLLEKYKFKRSTGRPGKSLDNRPIEYFFGVMKSEWIYHLSNKDINNIENEIHKYIHFYNNDRINIKFESSPIEYKHKKTQKR